MEILDEEVALLLCFLAAVGLCDYFNDTFGQSQSRLDVYHLTFNYLTVKVTNGIEMALLPILLYY